MASGVQDAADVLREVQKLTKELAPVKNALAALYKREEAGANADAAAASLDKIAARMEKVLATYKPILDGADELATIDLPNFLHQASLLLMEDESVEAQVALARAQLDRAARGEAPSGGSASRPSPISHSHSSRRRRRDDLGEADHGPSPAPATLFDDVCPPHVPSLLQPEDYRLYRQQLQLRVDMVTYLLATGRKSFALHVAESYRLPLLWFPALHDDRLQALRAVRSQSASRTRALTDTIPLSAAASPYMTARTVADNTPHRASPGTTTTFSTPGKPPMSPMQLATQASPPGATPTRPWSTEGPQITTPSAVFSAPSQPVSRRALHGGGDRPNGGSPYTGRASSLSPVSGPTVAEAASATDGVSRCASNLILRVVASAAYMKDDYMDRLVVQRLIQESQIAAEAAAAAAEVPATRHIPTPCPCRHHTTQGCRRALHGETAGVSVSSRDASEASSVVSSPAFPPSPPSHTSTRDAPPEPSPSSASASAPRPAAATWLSAVHDSVGDPLQPTRERADASREVTARVHTWPALTSESTTPAAPAATVVAHIATPTPSAPYRTSSPATSAPWHAARDRPASGVMWRAWHTGAVAPWNREAIAAERTQSTESRVVPRASLVHAPPSLDAELGAALASASPPHSTDLLGLRLTALRARPQARLLDEVLADISALRMAQLPGVSGSFLMPLTQTRGTQASRWRPVLRARAASLPVATLNTQSGFPAFDNTMMGLIEDLLANVLADPEPEATHLWMPCATSRAPHITRCLKPEGLLIADDAFTHEVLAIKRATRVFDGHSGVLVGGDPGDDALAGGVNVTVRGAPSPASMRHTEAADHYVLSTPNGAVWTGAGFQSAMALREAGPADALEDDNEERHGNTPARATMRVQNTIGVPSADGKVLYGVGTLRRIFIA